MTARRRASGAPAASAAWTSTRPAELVLPGTQTQHAESGTVVQGGVLKALAPRDLDNLHVHLDAVPGMGPLEQLELPGPAAPTGGLHGAQAEFVTDARDRLGRDLHVVDPHQPQASPAR